MFGATGALLSDVIAKAKGLDPAQLQKQDFITRMFGGLRRQIFRFQQRFETVAAQIDRITVELEKRIDLMRRDVTMLDRPRIRSAASMPISLRGNPLPTNSAAGPSSISPQRPRHPPVTAPRM